MSGDYYKPGAPGGAVFVVEPGYRRPDPGNRAPDPIYSQGPRVAEPIYGRGPDPRNPDPIYSRGPDPRSDPRSDPYFVSNRTPYDIPDIRAQATLMRPGDYGAGNSSIFPTYDVEHLATFRPSTGVPLTPEEAMQRLRQLAMKNGVWVMKVRLVVEPHDVVIIDPPVDAEMERLPLDLISTPAAFVSANRTDMHNNVLVFTVLGDTVRQSFPEMHVFQCLRQPAQSIVDAILAAKAGKIKGPVSMPAKPEPLDVWPERVLEYERAAQRTANAFTSYQQRAMTGQLSSVHPDNTESNERVTRNVELLNHCFDDIETFMGRLQEVADAYKELEDRRKTRKKKKPLPGDGMLSLRARNPRDQDFISILQKFKFSFNLLSQLKPHIHDPNAPELVHFLFTPLSLVVEASQDPKNGGPGLPSRVVSPLLTAEAQDLLKNCLTSKEMELWRSLGDSWTLSRDQWKAYVAPYKPRFYNWDPPPSKEDEEWANPEPNGVGYGKDYEPSVYGRRDSKDMLNNGPGYGKDFESPIYGRRDSTDSRDALRRDSTDSRDSLRNRVDSQGKAQPPRQPERYGDRYRDEDVYSREGGRQADRYRDTDRDVDRFREPDAYREPERPSERYREPDRKPDPHTREMNRTPSSDKLLAADKPAEEPVYGVAKKSGPAPLPKPAGQSNTLQVPKTALTASPQVSRKSPQPSPSPQPPKSPQPQPKGAHKSSDPSQDFIRELRAKGSKIFQVLKNRDSEDPKELSIVKGDILEIVDDSRKWWKVRNVRGETGFVPNTLLKEV